MCQYQCLHSLKEVLALLKQKPVVGYRLIWASNPKDSQEQARSTMSVQKMIPARGPLAVFETSRSNSRQVGGDGTS